MDGARPIPEPMRPEPVKARPRGRFTRRMADPPGIAWYGFRSLWGHLRHFAASAIAADGIDGREWMRPDPPEALTQRIAERIGAVHPKAPTLTETLEKDLWIDYLADSGEHAGVTEALARIVAREAWVPDPDGGEVLSPRGQLLIFGGDTAYPVATAREIHDRVVVPFNKALYEADDGEPRALLGIPGNHDWYDGLDGFSRMFRHKRFEEDDAIAPGTVRSADTSIGRAAELVKNIVAGESRDKADALVLHGYRPMQSASYWVLPLAPGLLLVGADRQLRKVDRQQRTFVQRIRDAAERKGPAPKIWALLPDPYLAFGRKSTTGHETVEALGLDPAVDDTFLLSGDIHHYRRERVKRALHVTAGGGGAFLHPAPIAEADDRNDAEVEWPSRAQSQRLLRQVPWYVALGRAGLIPHVVMGLLYAPFLGAGGWIAGHDGLGIATVVAGIVTALVYAFLGGVRDGPVLPIALLSAAAGATTSLIPMITLQIFSFAAEVLELQPNAWLGGVLALTGAMFAGGLVFGGFFAALTRLGLEETQAFTALAHPGFKHFVRFRVRADGSAIDGWVIGLEDPLDEDCEPVLVDRFRWVARPADADRTRLDADATIAD